MWLHLWLTFQQTVLSYKCDSNDTWNIWVVRLKAEISPRIIKLSKFSLQNSRRAGNCSKKMNQFIYIFGLGGIWSVKSWFDYFKRNMVEIWSRCECERRYCYIPGIDGNTSSIYRTGKLLHLLPLMCKICIFSFILLNVKH